MFNKMFLNNPYSNNYNRIDNPPTPFQGDIPNGLDNGKQIYISGTFNSKADNGRFDLVTGANQIALHINPRFNQNCIVRNSNLGGWGPEERSGSFPFKKGERFDLVIHVEDDKFKVSINGHHSFDYNHRTGYRDITKIDISGDLTIHQIVFSGGSQSNPNEVVAPHLPFSVPVQNGLAPGRMIQIHGQVDPNAKKFAINLQNGPGEYPNDIAFHFNPRYQGGSYVCLNNRRHGAWGSEVRESANPLQKGQSFEILLLCDASDFKVAVNGVHFIAFPHRNGLHDGNHLNIEGDVIIHSIRQF